MRPEWEEIESRRRRSEGGSRVILALAGIFGLAYVAWAYVAGGKAELQAEPPVHVATERAAPLPVDPRPAEPAPSAYQQPNRPTQGRQTYVGVYECVVNGQRVVSDKPCGPGAQARVLEVDQPDPRNAALLRQQTWAAQQSTADVHSSPVGSTGAAGADPVPARTNKKECDRIDKEIDNINSRMRQGYSAWEGERLRERLRY